MTTNARSKNHQRGMEWIRCALAILFFLTPACAVAAKLPKLYIRDHQYRFLSIPDARCTTLPADQQSCYDSTGGDGDARYSMNFIEFSDKGRIFDHRQLDAALKQLADAREGGQKAIVFIYIHGWHNNAGGRYNDLSKKDCQDHLYDGDVAKFEFCGLKKIACGYHSAPGAKAPRVIGIYLAWHGEDFTPWALLVPYYVPSYISRRHYAYKVGETGMESALQQLLDVIQQHRTSYFVIAMGHSFGARALENADLMLDPARSKERPSAQTHMESSALLPPSGSSFSRSPMLQETASLPRIERVQLQRPQVPLNRLPSPDLPIDLVFYVNAATSRYRTMQTIDDWNQKCAESKPPQGCGQDPLYLAVSSRADVLTAIVMPIANLVFPSWGTDRFHIISAANTPWMQTHSIPMRIPRPPETLSQDSFCFQTHDGPNDYLYEVQPKSRKTQSRFWVMNSDHRYAVLEGMLHKIPLLRRTVSHDWVISAHGDVWNPSVFNMIYALIETQTSTDKGRVTCYEETQGKQFQMK